MTARKHTVALGLSEVHQLEKIIKKGVSSARVINRARVLLMANENGEDKTDKEIVEALFLAKTTPQDIRRRFVKGGLSAALYDAPRPGQKRVCNPQEEVKITAIACTKPPDGYAHWTLDLLTQRITRDIKKIGRTTIHRILLRNNLQPWREKNVVHISNNS